MKNIKRTSVVAVATAAATLVAGGLAYGYWSTNGSGSAQASAGNALGVKGVAAPATSGAGTLYPNGNVPALISINNPNSFPVKVSRIQVAANSLPTSVSGNAACTIANSLVTMTADSGVLAGASQISVPANQTITTTVGTINMGLASDNACQGASFQFGSDSVAGPVVVTAQAG